MRFLSDWSFWLVVIVLLSAGLLDGPGTIRFIGDIGKELIELGQEAKTEDVQIEEWFYEY